ncbi:7TM GPCR, serpentine receptor class e (Sre) family-containing protein [Strongyloides ratti]|uniref:7TM GPCR, serpentine receptor class e (Sre) family-containing protein n=1 Tax=Strongyloides ratti TaxID=34506 RepID=A0A090LQK9_STRRB|nr:7TM GPCR, serpentine receptor class e (Sre) family-containing protein [Strongyloides ratti]CEF69856.1 7TM GPCR, serpentine receptor class e (Sre) family-containing protein [Strongyloides ratti]
MFLQKRLQNKVIEDFKKNSIFSLSQKYQILETEKTAIILLPFIVIVAITTFIIGFIYYLSLYENVSYETSQILIIYIKIIGYLRDTISVLFFLFITIPHSKWKKIFGKSLFKNRVSDKKSVKISFAGVNGSLYFEQLDKQWS